VSIDLEPGYAFSFVPESRNISLPDGLGQCNIAYGQSGNKLNLRFNTVLNRSYVESDYYEVLQNFFKEVVAAKTNDVLIVTKP